MRLKSITPIEPRASRCIEVDSSDRLFASGGSHGNSIISHNSVAQRNIIIGCIIRPDRWRIMCIDLKRVELSMYRAYKNVVMGVAVTVEQAAQVMRFAQETMMKRYENMEKLGISDFLNLPDPGPALMVMIDEMAELLTPSGNKSDQGKEEDELKAEIAMLVSSILRLGRAAGVHLVAATQRPDATFLTGQSKAQMAGRVNCGRTDSTASGMILGNGEGMRVRSNPRGRIYVQPNGDGDHGQGLYAPDNSWIDSYLESQGLDPEGRPITNRKRSRVIDIEDMSKVASGDLDSKVGKDNEAAIKRMMEEDESVDDLNEFVSDEDDDWGFDDGEDYEAEDPVEYDDGRPDLSKLDKPDENKWHRPEDDWDEDLDSLIEENNG